ncbi:glycosyltransferase family 69 protein [Parathielavia appendiculata]|uniref:Glycosyltransferase family 69 protein n=1 Tax=Parathielavia appendiculata TaxID=2587402 RepID=A0AAN6U5H4_9PEZI|nr:glycosyltransferase family 69 protein [Parathielavia appendiculata]
MRRAFLFWPATSLLLLVLTLYVRRDQLGFLPQHGLLQPQDKVQTAPPPPDAGAVASTATTTHPATLPKETMEAHVKAIMSPEATHLPHLECPKLDTSRYQHLQIASQQPPNPAIRYFFALDLRQCLTLLPRLIGSVVEVMRFLGPPNCALSIVEGNSDDGTGEVLAALRPELEALGITYYFSTTPTDPKQGDRIAALAQLRNLAVQPLLDAHRSTSMFPNESTTTKSSSTTITFLNDVAICPEDILELLHQRLTLQADMVCAMDWTYVGRDPTFYDVWIARGMSGDSFFEIPPDGSWDSAWNLFWNDAATRERFAARQPFQVFSCWNGAAVFSAAPVVERGVRFRTVREGECVQGEPQLFCKDLWWEGYGKIAVVPVVNLEYSDEAGRRIKEEKGYTSRWVGAPGWRDERIEWQARPPDKVKCMGRYDDQFFEAWNKSQPGT